MKKIITIKIELNDANDESFDAIADDIVFELGCCWNAMDFDKISVQLGEQIKTWKGK